MPAFRLGMPLIAVYTWYESTSAATEAWSKMRKLLGLLREGAGRFVFAMIYGYQNGILEQVD